MSITRYVAILYAMAAILTFGHYMNNPAIEHRGDADIMALPASAAWPLYWSWEIQRNRNL